MVGKSSWVSSQPQRYNIIMDPHYTSSAGSVARPHIKHQLQHTVTSFYSQLIQLPSEDDVVLHDGQTDKQTNSVTCTVGALWLSLKRFFTADEYYRYTCPFSAHATKPSNIARQTFAVSKYITKQHTIYWEFHTIQNMGQGGLADCTAGRRRRLK